MKKKIIIIFVVWFSCSRSFYFMPKHPLSASRFFLLSQVVKESLSYGKYPIGNFVMKLAHKKIEEIDERLRNKTLQGGNLLYIIQMNNSWMIQMKRPPFYI